MRPIAVIFAGVLLAVSLAVSWAIATKTISWVEASQKAELEQAFYAGGIDWTTAEADGFLVRLSGQAQSEQAQERAVNIATLIFGDNLLNETTALTPEQAAPPVVPPFVEILKNGNDFSFIGQMPTGETQEVFARHLSSLSDDVTITNVTKSIEAAPDNWLPAFKYGLQLASLIDQAILNISPGEVTLEAVASSKSWQQGFEEMAEKLRPEGVTLSVNISAPRPVISPYEFILDVAQPNMSICSAQDEAEAALIFDEVDQKIGLNIKCSVGIGAPSRHWRQAIEAGIAALATLEGGRLEITDADVVLKAPAGTALQAFETTAQALRLALPDGFSLAAIASEAPPRREVEETREIEFRVSLGKDGAAIIEGSVKDALTREVVMRFSEAKFGYGRVEDRLWLDGSLPDGWQARIFALIEAVALLNEGRADMAPETLEIIGDAAFENANAELGKLLGNAYSDANITLDISYTEPQGVEGERGLDPRLCVSRVAKLLTENSIVFAPSSAIISDPSIPTIEAIAAILAQCREARIEIGGHTDSQGRDEMNRTLSQGRADAVLDALLAQNLLLGELNAKGYGEAEPIADNGTEEGRTRNRRIEFKLLREDSEPEPAVNQRVIIEQFSRPAMRAPNAN